MCSHCARAGMTELRFSGVQFETRDVEHSTVCILMIIKLKHALKVHLIAILHRLANYPKVIDALYLESDAKL